MGFRGVTGRRARCVEGDVGLVTSRGIADMRMARTLTASFTRECTRKRTFREFCRKYRCISLVRSGAGGLSYGMCSYSCTGIRPVSNMATGLTTFFKFTGPNRGMVTLRMPSKNRVSRTGMDTTNVHKLGAMFRPLSGSIVGVSVSTVGGGVLRRGPRVILFKKDLFLFPRPVGRTHRTTSRIKTGVVCSKTRMLNLVTKKRFRRPLGRKTSLVVKDARGAFPNPRKKVVLSRRRGTRVVSRTMFPNMMDGRRLRRLLNLNVTATRVLRFNRTCTGRVVGGTRTLNRTVCREKFSILYRRRKFARSRRVTMSLSGVESTSSITHRLTSGGMVLGGGLLPNSSESGSSGPSNLEVNARRVAEEKLGRGRVSRITRFVGHMTISGRSVNSRMTRFVGRCAGLRCTFSSGSTCRCRTL